MTSGSHSSQTPGIRAEIGRTVRLAGPVIAAQIGMMLMGLTDVLFVGPLGAEALAAVSVGNSVFFAILILFNGIVMAAEPLVSQSVGAGRLDRAGGHLWQAGWLALLFGVPLTLLFLDSAWAFRLLNQPPRVAALAGDYLSGRAWAVVPFLAFQAGRSFLNGIGRPRAVMIITLALNGLNVLADWAFIYGHLGLPAFGVLGAGMATSVSRVAMLLALVWVLSPPRYSDFQLGPRRPEGRRMWQMVRLGVPIGGQQFAEVAVFAAASVLAGWLGAEAQAAHQIALSLASFTFMVPLGLSMAATVRVGHEVGRGDPDGAMRAGRVSLGLGASFMSLGALAFVTIPGLLVSAFSAPPGVHETAVGLLGIAAVFQISDGLQVTGSGCLRGAGDTRTPFLANVFSHWAVGLPLGWFLAFPMGLGVRGLWWGLTTSLTLVAVILTFLFVRGGWRRLGALVD